MTDQPKKPNVSAASTALPNHRRELFAQLLVQGFTAAMPMKKLGTSDMTATPVLSQSIQRFKLD